jgi:hypothetical protein
MELGLARDLLDKQLVDREGRPMGKCDGLVVRWRPSQPPQVTHLELGGATLARRLPRPWQGIMLWLSRRFGARGGEPYRIDVARIVHFGNDVKIDIDATRTPALATERWVRDHVITRIPGA